MDEGMKDAMPLDEGQLDEVCGGATKNLVTAYDVLAGKYGEGEKCRRRLAHAGYDCNTVLTLVNALQKGYGPVARDVIDGKYGSGAAQRANLIHAGYDPDQVQFLVSSMSWH